MAKRIPDHIGDQGRAWLKKVFSEYSFSDTEITVVYVAAECIDRLKQVREQIDCDGLTVKDRFGALKAHPLCAIERDNRLTFLRITRQLGIADSKGDR